MKKRSTRKVYTLALIHLYPYVPPPPGSLDTRSPTSQDPHEEREEKRAPAKRYVPGNTEAATKLAWPFTPPFLEETLLERLFPRALRSPESSACTRDCCIRVLPRYYRRGCRAPRTTPLGSGLAVAAERSLQSCFIGLLMKAPLVLINEGQC